MSQIPDAFQFEWDEQKNSINKKKHGISFETAMHVFNDPLRLDFSTKSTALRRIDSSQ